MRKLFNINKERSGYRRIHSSLKKARIIVSEKIASRIMNEKHLIVKNTRKQKYNFIRVK